MFRFDVQLVQLLKREPRLTNLTAEDEVRLSAVVLHEMLEVVVPGGKVFRVVANVAARAQAVVVGAVVTVFDHLVKDDKLNVF